MGVQLFTLSPFPQPHTQFLSFLVPVQRHFCVTLPKEYAEDCQNSISPAVIVI